MTKDTLLATEGRRAPDGDGLSSTTEPCGLGPSGFDPSRALDAVREGDYRTAWIRTTAAYALHRAALKRATEVLESLAEHSPDCFGWAAPFPSKVPAIRIEAERARAALSFQEIV